jgi:hypothetical protein
LKNNIMPKSRVRGGAKVHRKKVAARAQHMKDQTSAFQKILKRQIEEFKQKNAESGTTENQ